MKTKTTSNPGPLSRALFPSLHSIAAAVACVGAFILISSTVQAQNLYESDLGTGNIYEFTPGGTQSTFATFGSPSSRSDDYPLGVAFDNTGNLFVAGAAWADLSLPSGRIIKITPTGAQSTFASGDLFVATQSGNIQWRDSMGIPYPQSPTMTGDFGDQAGMRNNPVTGELWVTNFNALNGPPSVRFVETNGASGSSVSFNNLQSHPESVVFDATGSFAYVGGPGGQLVKVDAIHGNVVTSYVLPGDHNPGPDWIDLASDQRTIFYTSEGVHIQRYDLLTGTPLLAFADLSSFTSRLFALRLLPDGGLLVAGQNAVYRLNSTGAVIQTYDTPGEDFYFSLALTPDCTSFWTGSLFTNNNGVHNVYEYNIATGQLERMFNAGLPVGGLAVFGDNCTPAPPAPGFVIGDLNAVVGNHVMFWGAQWWKHNSLSGGPAPASFKGFANSPNPNPPACGGTWQSDPGNSSGPPHSVPAYIIVIVSSSITKSGSTISGNVPEMVIVHTDPGYDGNPGHAGTGTVTAVVCP